MRVGPPSQCASKNGRRGEEARESDTGLPREGTSLPVRLTFPRRGRVRTAETVHGGHTAVRHGACEPFRRDSDLKAALMTTRAIREASARLATRAGILESLVKKRLLQRKGKQIRSTTAGRMLVGVAIDELKDVKLTAQWEQSLADIGTWQGATRRSF